MIGFGELRKLSVQWRVDITDVERAHAIDWLLKGLFDHALLGASLVLRASAALRYAHFIDYPFIAEPEFLTAQAIDAATLTSVANAAASASGLKFSLVERERGSAKIEYTGPLGRRSAAQPRITLAFIVGQTRIEPARAALLHRFSDDCAANVMAVALEEFAAERWAMLGASPRARDVFDLWFVLTHARERNDRDTTRRLLADIARTKNLPRLDQATRFEPTYRPILARAWVRARLEPSFAQVEQDLAQFAL